MAGEPGAPRLSAETTSETIKPVLSPEELSEYQRQVADELLQSQGQLKTGQNPYELARQLSPSPVPCQGPPIEPRASYNPIERFHVSAPQPKVSRFWQFWARNKGPILVAASQLFGALMNLSARFLEVEGKGMHPIQVLFLRQIMTSLCCFSYMWWNSTPGFPFGYKEVRGLLFIRGISGFLGIYGMWYSMMYLPLADATVITFLAPGVAGCLCYFVLREPFTRIEQLATFVALLGVVLIAQPATLFAKSPSEEPSTDQPSSAEPPEGPNTALPGLEHDTTPEERLIAVGVALLGVMGASGAFTTLRAIGKRAHPLISVNFFAVTCTVICTVVLIAAPLLDISQPALSWTWPASARGWFLLFILGLLGFVMQYLLTAGLASDKSNRANSMIYTHMLFAVSFDRWVFHHHMNVMSFSGCALILGSAVGVIVMKKAPPPKAQNDVERQGNLVGEEEASPMLVGVGGHSEIPLERVR